MGEGNVEKVEESEGRRMEEEWECGRKGGWKGRMKEGKVCVCVHRGRVGSRGNLISDGLVLALDTHREFPGALRHHAYCGGHAPPVPGAGSGTAHAAGQHRCLEDHQPLPQWCW